jgi:adenine-specific DNA-methyltransferase
MTITEIRNLFEKPYEQTTWKTFLQTYFQNMELFLTPQEIDLQPNKLSEKCFALGNYKIDKYLKIGFFEIHLNEKVKLTRNRLGLRTLLKNITMQMAGAMVVFVQGDKWRFSYISKRKMINKDTNLIEEKETAAKRYTYLFGKNEKALTAATRFQKLKEKQNAGLFQSLTLNDFEEAFSVEKLSKDFFFEYKNHYNKFIAYITQNFKGKSFFLGNDEDKAIRDFAKKLLGRIVFLYFVQKKGWLGASELSYKDGKLNFITDLFHASGGNELFYPQWLTSLFFDTLNNPDRKTDNFVMPDNSVVKIPFLNGGLFDKEKQDDNSFLLTIEPSLFHSPKFSEIPEKRGFLDFLNAYNFTVQEDAPDEHTVAVDPEMLGNIFENLLEDNKDKGAFYTPKEIVHFMCKESIKEYLLNGELSKENTDILEECIQKVLEQSELTDAQQDFILENAYKIADILENVKVCDPAIGSGAFPMGLLLEIFNAVIYLHELKGFVRNVSEAQIKKTIIEKCIYGVDIEKGAVDIARLRFWLSLVVDEEMPQALPNLDYKIVVGNSLIPELNIDNLTEVIRIDWTRKSNVGKADEYIKNIQTGLKTLTQKQRKYFSTDDKKRKKEIAEEIHLLKMGILRNQLQFNLAVFLNKNSLTTENSIKLSAKDQKKNLEITLEIAKFEQLLVKFEKLEKQDYRDFTYFDWLLNFPEVLNPYLVENEAKRGFDIMIGNPPYGAKLSAEYKEVFKNEYAEVHTRTPDTFNYFTALAFQHLTRKNAIVAFIVPNNLFFQTEYEKTRRFLIEKNQLLLAVNLGDGVFESATVPACIFIGKKDENPEYQEFRYADLRYFKSAKIELISYVKPQKVAQILATPALVFGISGIDFDILETIRQKSYTIEEIAEEMASGISTGNDKVFRISAEKAAELNLEKELLRPVLVGGDIDRYKITDAKHFIIYTTKNCNIEKMPNTLKYLIPFKNQLGQKRETLKGLLPWWCIHWARYEGLFAEPKIIMRQTADNIKATYDEKAYFTLDSILVYKRKEAYKESIDYKFILAMFNSKVNQFAYRNFSQEEGRTFAQVKSKNVKKLFVPKITKEAQQPFIALVDYILWLNEHEKPNASRYMKNKEMIAFFEEVLNMMVFELYFPQEMQEKGIDVLQFVTLQNFPDILHLESKEAQANSIYVALQWLMEKENPIRNRAILANIRSEILIRVISTTH